MSPTTQKALILEKKFGNYVVASSFPVPKPKKDEVLVKIHAAALNPIDWKVQKTETYSSLLDIYPSVLGENVAGEVVELGEGVSELVIGDRVFFEGVLNQSEHNGYQEYTTADVLTLAKIPSKISYEEAASFPTVLTTAYVGLYNARPHGLGFEPPVTEAGKGKYAGVPLVIIGGSSSVGQFVIQLAKLSGFSPIITTSSLKHEEYLKSLGATHVLDRHEPLTTERIQSITDLPIKAIYDAISDSESQDRNLDLLAPGGDFAIVLFPEPKLVERASKENKRLSVVIAVKVLPENVQVVRQAWPHFEPWLENGDIKPLRVDILPGGLNGVVDGLKRMEDGKVSRVRLVVRPQETA
ncbi:chaperonin 10-like protein [Ephemerocybe angulata]|uniref:Chaperonin 10-like protein n=1 Tax=Ephemerocybe angulata TaxID=980116 RepID=A0A8H6M1W4_9AGAR|nr:chaperonin 10-like protein [Tulosesus angulatus]